MREMRLRADAHDKKFASYCHPKNLGFIFGEIYLFSFLEKLVHRSVIGNQLAGHFEPLGGFGAKVQGKANLVPARPAWEMSQNSLVPNLSTQRRCVPSLHSTQYALLGAAGCHLATDIPSSLQFLVMALFYRLCLFVSILLCSVSSGGLHD
jgi:hypothetical protein